MRRALGVTSVFLILFANPVNAKDLCEEYANYTPLPSWYTEVCNGPARKGLSQIGGAYSSFGDAFNLNPASIPTAKTPIGVEYITSFSGSGTKSSFALIKGFGTVGTAMTTNSDETFYGNNVFQTQSGQLAFDANGNPIPAPSTTTRLPTLNLGSALSLDKLIDFKKLVPFDLASNLGVVAKYNKMSGGFTNGYGFGFSLWKLSFGISYTRDPQTAFSPEVNYTTITLGLKTSICQIEWVTINSQSLSQTMYDSFGFPIGVSSYSVRPATMITISGKLGGLLLTGAARSFQDALGANHSQYHAAVEYIISPKVALEYLNNYVIDHQSLGLQVLF